MIKIDKAEFGRRAKYLVELMHSGLPGSVFDMMAPELADWDETVPSVTVAYPVYPWERNPGGEVNGGVVATMMDAAMGTLTHALCGGMTPTVSLSTCYLRPAPGEGRLLVRATSGKAGRNLIFVDAVLYGEGREHEIAATAQGIFKVPEK